MDLVICLVTFAMTLYKVHDLNLYLQVQAIINNIGVGIVGMVMTSCMITISFINQLSMSLMFI